MIGYLFLFVIIMSAVTVFFVKLLVRIMGKYGGESIAKLHRDSECITNRGMVPPGWAKPWIEKISKAESGNYPVQAVEELKKKAKRDFMKKLDKIITHFKRTSIIEDEEVRDILIKQLSGAREKWQKNSWEELI